jgi:hypothetical protein
VLRRLGLGAALGLLALGGCARRAPLPAFRPVTAEALLDGLAARRAAVTSLRAQARLRTGLSGLWTRQALLVRRPDAVRIDVLSPFGLALALGAQGPLLWAYPPAEATRYEGPATPANLTRFLGAPVAVRDIVDLLLGVPPARTAAGPLGLSHTPEGEYRLRVPLEDGEQTIWFAGDTLAVLRAEERRGATVTLTIAFSDYRDGFARSLEVGAPESGAQARLRYEALEPNAAIDPALFAPPPAPRVLPLEPSPEAGLPAPGAR